MRYKRLIQISVFISLFFILNTSATSCKSIGRARPNFVVILTDDMDLKLTPHMPKTDALIAKQGAVLTNYYVTSPLCCPSRASMLRGQYPHNTGVLENVPPAGSFKRFYLNGEENETLAVWLNRKGYNTSLVGKYLNLYPVPAGGGYIPPGWTDWHVFLFKKDSPDFYYNYNMNENGKIVSYGDSAQDYSTDVIRQKSIDFINQSVADNSPFFILISVYGPHGPSIPAPRHSETFADLKYPQSPSFSEADISDKPAIIQAVANSGDDYDAGDANHLYARRARSLQAVDELVDEVVRVLEQNGQLDNTYIIFTSDNGFHMGEHRLPSGKGIPYEEDIHVPFMLRGPGIQPNVQINQMVANIDLAPTIAEMAGADFADFVDGRSFLSLLAPQPNQAIAWREALIIEMGKPEETASSAAPRVSLINSSQGFSLAYPDFVYDSHLLEIAGGAFRAVRTTEFMYAEYDNGEIEFYDLIADPFELKNIALKLKPELLSALHTWLNQLATCTAKDCRNLEEALPEILKDRPWN